MIQDIAPHTFDNQYHPDRKPAPDDIVFDFKGQSLLCREEEGGMKYLRVSELADTDGLTYLFSVDERGFFLLPAGAGVPEGYDYVEIWRSRGERTISKEMMFAIATGKHLTHWYRTHRYCGCCGNEFIHADDERALVCPACGFRTYPRIMPAVIIGVTNGEFLLVTRYSDRPLPYYALVAGFVEIGETLEECVAREAMEEVGLHVKNIRYYKSQPWGIVDDVLTGFFCDVDGDPSVKIDYNELGEAIWAPRGEVPLQPDRLSLTEDMMRAFNEGRV